MSKRTFSIVCIPGDGIGVDITDAATQVLTKLSSTFGTFTLKFDTLDWSSKNYKERGYYAPEGGVNSLKKYGSASSTLSRQLFTPIQMPYISARLAGLVRFISYDLRRWPLICAALDVPDHISLWQVHTNDWPLTQRR